MEKINISGKTVLIALLFGFIFVIGCTDETQVIPEEKIKTPDIVSFKTISSGTTQTGDVLVELSPHAFDNGKLNVDFSANTHSVDLGQFDLMQITTLEYDGNVLKPISAPSLSGHHNSGTLVFGTGKELKRFKIIINDIPDVKERVFEWNIK